MTANLDIVVQVNDDQWLAWHTEDEWSLFAENICRRIFDHLNFQHDTEVSIVLTNNAEIQILNKNYRGFDKPTNVLSFPIMNSDDLRKITTRDYPILLGDVIIAFETVVRETETESKTFMHHVSHLLVHGVLHLLGYDHENDSDAEVMETLEIEILDMVGIKNPYQ